MELPIKYNNSTFNVLKLSTIYYLIFSFLVIDQFHICKFKVVLKIVYKKYIFESILFSSIEQLGLQDAPHFHQPSLCIKLHSIV